MYMYIYIYMCRKRERKAHRAECPSGGAEPPAYNDVPELWDNSRRQRNNINNYEASTHHVLQNAYHHRLRYLHYTIHVAILQDTP